ncbi:amidohydrolase family protein [Caballeronia sp. LjRoot34]|uniref:metal-dependent hydrolase family protein n=1 Tax=Caballeronia sp. LjRoot34 TaxID=3342325 RepID=UPI003ECDC6B1
MNSVLFRNGCLLVPGETELVGERDVLVEDGLIKEVSDRPIKASSAREIDVRGKTLMPGLIDLHVHVFGLGLNIDTLARTPNVLVTLRAVPGIAAMLRRGFTTVRDAGGANFAIREAIESGVIAGPRMFVSGRSISQTGGHGDKRSRSDFLLPDFPECGCVRVGGLNRVADGLDGVRKAVREEFQMGADQIKIMASGGVSSPTDPIGALGYSEEETRAIVAEAHSRHTYVMAHAYTAEAIGRAVRCGVRSIEHGNLIDLATAELMSTAGAYAVPTLITYRALASEGQSHGLPPESMGKIAEVKDASMRSLELFRQAGVKMGFGTDLLGASQRLQSEEFRIRCEVLPPSEVIRSATTIGAEILNMQGKLGELVPNAFADLLVVDGNPLRDINCLTGQGESIPLVMKGGKICFDELTA